MAAHWRNAGDPLGALSLGYGQINGSLGVSGEFNHSVRPEVLWNGGLDGVSSVSLVVFLCQG